MLTIDWATKIIFVPKTYTQFVSNVLFEIRQLDIDQFRLDLRTIEAEVFGMVNERTHTHNTTVEVGGVTLARVVSLVNGYTVTFEDGVYAVNLSGANSNIADNTNLNQVQIRSANSAGLTFSEEINNQSYLGAKVFINTDGLGLPGTQFPRGTPTSPVDNWDDAFTIATTRNFNSYDLHGILTFSGSTDLSHTDWYGISPITSIIHSPITTIDVDSSTFNRMGMHGSFSGKTSHNEGNLATSGIDFIGFHGIASNCGINGNIEIGEGVLDSVVFRNCFSNIAGTTTPIIDFSKMTNSNASFRGYNGGLQINGFTSGCSMSLDISTGNIILDPTCVGGTIVLRGVCTLTDNSSSGCTVVTSGQLDPSNLFTSGNTTTISDGVWEAIANNQNPGTFGQLLVDLFSASSDSQHTLNVHTELLKNNSK